MNLGPALGKIQFLRGKSQWYLETLRAWVTPAAAAGAYVKYLGFSSRWSVAVAVGMPILVECFGFFLGRFLYDKGGVEAEYTLAMRKDPYKVAQMEYQERTLAMLQEIRDASLPSLRLLSK